MFKRVGRHRVALVRVDGDHSLRYEIPTGERLPLHLGAGKVLCAAMPPEELKIFLAQVPDLTRVDGTARSRAEFEAELAEIRANGYSSADAERVPGMMSVAAPLPPREGTATEAVQVSGTADEIPPDRIKALGNEVQRAAYAIARRIY